MNDVGCVHNVNGMSENDANVDLIYSVNTGEIVKCTDASVNIMSPAPLTTLHPLPK